MTLLAPGALVGLILLPLLVVLYLFRPDPRQLGSTTYFLWKAAAPDSQGGTFARRLQSNPLMWLQLLFLLLLVIYLARPSTPWKSQVPISEKVVILLDRSASMGAGDAFSKAKQRAREAVDEMLGFRLAGTSPDVMLVALDSEARVLVPFTKDKAQLERALDRLRQSHRPDKLQEMGPFVRSLIKSHKARVWLFSDHCPEPLQVGGLQFTSMAPEGENNVGLVSFSVRQPEPERGRKRPFLYARAENFSPQAQQRILTLEKMSLDSPDRVEAVVSEQNLLLAAHSGQTLVEPLPATRFDPEQPAIFRLRLSPVPGQAQDLLPVDDIAYCVVPPFEKDRILVAVGEGVKSPFLLQAVSATSGVRVVKLQELSSQASPPTVDLLISTPEEALQPTPSVRSRFVLAPPVKDNTPVERLSLGEARAPLVSESGVEWTRLKAQISDRSPLEPGEMLLLKTDSSPALTLSGLEKGLPTLRWRFPLSRSSLPLSTALPVVVGRFVDRYSRSETVSMEGSVSTEQSVERPSGHRWRGPLLLTPLTTTARNLEEERTVEESASNFGSPGAVGVYRLEAPEEEKARPLAVNLFSIAESELPRDSNDALYESGETSEVQARTLKSETQYREVGVPLLVIALILLLLEGFWFLKRGRP